MNPDFAKVGDLRGKSQTSRTRRGRRKEDPTSQPRCGHLGKGKPSQLRGGHQGGPSPRDGGRRGSPSHSPSPRSWSGSWPQLERMTLGRHRAGKDSET